MIQFNLGTATIDPQNPAEAGSFTTITYTFTGGHPIDDSGYVKIAFRSVGDYGQPQFDDPAGANYCTITTSGDCQIEPRWDPKGHTRPWSRALFLKVRHGYLDQGETIQVVFGDTTWGSPGWQVQTNRIKRFEFKTLVDPIATYRFKEIQISPWFEIIPGRPDRAVCIAPSQIRIGQTFTYHLKLEDRWGNPTEKPKTIKYPGFSTLGFKTVQAVDESTGLSAESNPIDVRENSQLHSFWGDMHGQSGETVGDGTIEEYFAFAKDYGFLDISAHSGNDFQVTDEFWEKINQVSHQFYQPGEFVTFPGYEWSGNTPLGGDRNVFFTSEGGQITRSSTDLIPDNHSIFPDSPTAIDLFANLSKQERFAAFTFAHVGGRYANLKMHDPDIELAVEIHSAWGTFEWFVEEALQLGYRIGICANSDGHKCRPGASYPGAKHFGSLGGLTCVLAQSLTRESIFAAIKARHFYATTGNRSLMDVNLITKDKRQAIMGDVIDKGHGEPVLELRVVGSCPIEKIEVRNGTKLIHTHRPYGDEELGRRVKVTWSGAEVRGRDRMTAWDGGLKVQNNFVLSAIPVNFWNANQPLKKTDDHKLTWKSVTTGGLSGVILELEEAHVGSIFVDTLQGHAACQIESIGLEPLVWDFGGLLKEICIYRLPDRLKTREISLELPLTELHEGDNPIIVHLVQEDGHMAWSSPIYLVA